MAKDIKVDAGRRFLGWSVSDVEAQGNFPFEVEDDNTGRSSEQLQPRRGWMQVLQSAALFAVACACGLFALQLFTSSRRFSCRPPAKVLNAATLPCEPTWRPFGGAYTNEVPAGGLCRPRCSVGFEVVDSTPLSCTQGMLSPASFECEPKPCRAPTNVFHSHEEGTCIEGPLINSSVNCTTRCASTYVRSRETLTCLNGAFYPPSFTCTPLPCKLPNVQDIENAAPGICAEVHEELSGEQDCTPSCKEGYVSDTDHLHCEHETLTPTTFKCLPAPCQAPRGIPDAGTVACLEGPQISHNGECTAVCQDGFSVVGHKKLECAFGKFTGEMFKCSENSCKIPPDINHVAASGPCEESSIAENEKCIAQCEAGYSPSAEALLCRTGKLTPPTFTCGPSACLVDTGSIPHVNALEPCKGLGKSVMDKAKCQVQCEDGYKPYPDELLCSMGNFMIFGAPGGAPFQCSAKSCSTDALQVIENVDKDLGSCRGSKLVGTWIIADQTCTASCAKGYSPDRPYLTCLRGSFEPAAFKCNPDPCTSSAIPPVEHESKDRGRCTAATMATGEACEALCEEGYMPEPAYLQCSRGSFLPTTFECLYKPCAIPKVENTGELCQNAKVGAKLVKSGDLCEAECSSGYSPSIPNITCANGTWSGDVKCTPLPCMVNIPNGSCAEGSQVESGEKCTVVCKTGFTPTTKEDVVCKAGAWSSQARCEPAFCQLPADVENKNPKGVCRLNGGDGGFLYLKRELPHGTSCSPMCQDGFLPSLDVVTCKFGVLDPPTFTCLKWCTSPAVENMDPAGVCVNGPVIESGKLCQTRCMTGYIASDNWLGCENGIFSPPTFTCTLGSTCAAPKLGDIAQADPTGSCFWSAQIGHLRICTPRCVAGYQPNPALLFCENGRLKPSGNFTCEPVPSTNCKMPAVENAKELDITCKPGTVLPEGDLCRVGCNLPYQPTVAEIACVKGYLQPASYSCIKIKEVDPPVATTTTTQTTTLTGTTITATTTNTSTEELPTGPGDTGGGGTIPLNQAFRFQQHFFVG